MVNGSLVFHPDNYRDKFCGASPALRVAANRFRQAVTIDLINIKPIKMKILVLITVLGLSSFRCEGQNLSDIQLVKGVINDFQNDFNEGSFTNVNSYTTSDWEHIAPNGGISKGRENVLKEVKAVHQSFLKGITMKIESIEIRFIAPSVAVADVIHIMDNFVTPDGIKHISERQIKTYIVIKQDCKWLLTHDQNTSISN